MGVPLPDVIINLTAPIIVGDGVIRRGVSKDWQVQFLTTTARAMASLLSTPPMVVPPFSSISLASSGISGRSGVIRHDVVRLLVAIID